MKCPKCGAELSNFEPELTYLKEAGLDYLTEEQRIQYIGQIISGLAEALKKINQQQGIFEKLKLAKQFLSEWEQQGSIIILALLYSVKPEFRQYFYQLLQQLQQQT